MKLNRSKRKKIVLKSADSGSKAEMTFVNIPPCPAGFLMGNRGQNKSEEPVHRVVIPEDFWLGETPVTQAKFMHGREQKNGERTIGPAETQIIRPTILAGTMLWSFATG